MARNQDAIVGTNPEGHDEASTQALAKLDKARQLLANADTTPQQVKRLRDLSMAAQEWAKRQNAKVAYTDAFEIQMLSERRLAPYFEQLVRNPQHQGEKLKAPSNVGRRSEYQDVLEELSLDRQTVARICTTAEVPDSVLLRYLADCRETDSEDATRQGLLRFASAKDGQALVSSDSNEWYTLAEYIEAARTVLGTINLDPASHPLANQVVKADRFFTVEDDGLFHDWDGRVWLNPPWGDAGPSFVGKLVDSYESGHVTAAILLVNAHATDTAWFQPLWDYFLCFSCPRIRYWQPDGEAKSPTTGSVFVYFGPKAKSFQEIFSRFGAIVSRV